MNVNIINLRKGMIAELDTVNQYTKMMDECDDESIKKLFADIIKEELVHVGEFQRGINSLCPIQQEKIDEGMEEADAQLPNDMTHPDIKPMVSLDNILYDIEPLIH